MYVVIDNLKIERALLMSFIMVILLPIQCLLTNREYIMYTCKSYCDIYML